MISSVLKEYGMSWALNRGLYTAKLKMLSLFPASEKMFEKKIPPALRTDVFSFNLTAIEEFLISLPEDEKEKITAIADRACEGKIKGFSSVEMNYGNPIDWQLNPLTGKRCDESSKWYRIKDFDADRGDIKAIWEISRFSHFSYLIRAYLLTVDKKYYLAFSEQLNDWIEKNPYSYGANYKCGQECAFRMINGLMAYNVFSAKNLTNANDERNIKKLVELCYRKIRSNFFYAYRCIKNNHTISELLGMAVGAWCCDDKKQLDKAYRLMDKVIGEQFLDDGGYTQFSFNYQRLALQDMECLLSISGKTGRNISDESKSRVLRSAELLYQCQLRSGDVPNYGPNDGALVFPLSCCGYRDFRPVVSTVVRMLTGRRIFEKGLYDEEYLWFSDNSEQREEVVSRKSSAFEKAGLFTLRNSRCLAMLVANDFHSRPAHMDQLHFDLWIDGVNVFCDTGTYSYADELGRGLSNTSGHNTLVVPNFNQMNRHGAFMVYDWTERKSFCFKENLISGEIVSKNGYSHSRVIIETENGFALRDEMISSNGQDGLLYFHTPCDIQIENSAVVLLWQGKKICTVKSNSLPEVRGAYRSLYYLQKEKCNLLIYSGEKEGKNITWELNISCAGE